MFSFQSKRGSAATIMIIVSVAVLIILVIFSFLNRVRGNIGMGGVIGLPGPPLDIVDRSSFQQEEQPTLIGNARELLDEDILMEKAIFYEDYGYGTVGITDTRQFLKTTYHGTLQTRQVIEMVEELQNIIEDHDGRIDSVRGGNRLGALSFVLPKAEFDSFKGAMRELAHPRLYVEDISSENLLGEKQMIEATILDHSQNLDELDDQREQLEAGHAARVSSLQSQIANLQGQLNDVRMTLSLALFEDDMARNNMLGREASLISSIASLERQLANEHARYASESDMIDGQTEYIESRLDASFEEDMQFMNNIETVDGDVFVYWISVWELLQLRAPWFIWIVIFICLLGVVIGIRKGVKNRRERRAKG